jgi:hypothetical protein
MHADLLVHKQNGQAIAILGAPGTGKSLFSAVAAGDPAQGYSVPLDSAAWQYRVNDWVLVVKIGKQFYAGLPPENTNRLSLLKTRMPLPGAVQVDDEESEGVRYQTQLSERAGFVPLEAVVWLNNQERLQQTRDWDQIFGEHTEWKSWARGFFNQFMALPFREIALPEPAAVETFDAQLLVPYQEAAQSIQQWFETQVASEAGLEESQRLFDPVRLIASSQKLLIFSPEMAVNGARVIHLFNPYQGEKIQVAMVVEDFEQKNLVESLLPAAVSVEWVVLSETAGRNQEEAMLDLETSAWQQQRETYRIQTQDDLNGLGKFLGIDPVDERTYQEWIVAVATLTAA